MTDSGSAGVPQDGDVLMAGGAIRPFTAAEKRENARRAREREAARAWLAGVQPEAFRDLRPISRYADEIYRWLMKRKPDDPDRRRFETLLRQRAAVDAELSVRYWAVGTKKRDEVMRAIRRMEMETE